MPGYPSQTTPGHIYKQAYLIAVEKLLVAERGSLPPYFWRDRKYKSRYTTLVSMVRRAIKVCGEEAVIQAVASGRIKVPSHQKLIFEARKFIVSTPVNTEVPTLPEKPVAPPNVSMKPSFKDLMS